MNSRGRGADYLYHNMMGIISPSIVCHLSLSVDEELETKIQSIRDECISCAQITPHSLFRVISQIDIHLSSISSVLVLYEIQIIIFFYPTLSQTIPRQCVVNGWLGNQLRRNDWKETDKNSQLCWPNRKGQYLHSQQNITSLFVAKYNRSTRTYRSKGQETKNTRVIKARKGRNMPG